MSILDITIKTKETLVSFPTTHAMGIYFQTNIKILFLL